MNTQAELMDTGANCELQVVAFVLGKEEYAVDILAVQEINKLPQITRVPRAPHYIEGVINLRGNVIPVLNLHKRFGLGDQGITEETRIIVFEHNDITAGIIVDQVTEVSLIKAADIEETSRVYSSIDAELIRGVGKLDDRLLILLNLEKLVAG